MSGCVVTTFSADTVGELVDAIRAFNEKTMPQLTTEYNPPQSDQWKPILDLPKINSPEFMQFCAPDLIPFMVPRSGKWPRLERIHLAQHPECEVCGTKIGCVGHHIKPVHLFPEYELDPDNVLTLCNSRWHHILFGHLMNWKAYNPDVRAQAVTWKRMITERPLAGMMKGIPDYQTDGIKEYSEIKCDALFLAYPEIQ